ncbi:MAG TPA: hypothetical protein VLA12_08870, partial [Planctomycetaceae bacterium]|nr:hypothetical protein [Planctomycetaceae bacterium]
GKDRSIEVGVFVASGVDVWVIGSVRSQPKDQQSIIKRVTLSKIFPRRCRSVISNFVVVEKSREEV